MASTYSTNLGIELIGTGDQSGTWGATTNTNFGTLVEQAIVGYSTQAVIDSGTATVLTIANGASSTGRNYVITLTGALTAARTVEVPAVNKPYIFFNSTTGGFAVTVKVTGQTGVTIANGKKAIVYTNTTDVIEVANAPATEAGTQTLTNKTLTSPLIGTVIGGTTTSSSLTLQSTSGVGTSDSIFFKVGNNGATTAMTVDTSGNVGVGTSSPGSRFDVYSATSATMALNGDSTTQYSIGRYSSDASSPNVSIRKYRGSVASPTAANSSDQAGSINFAAFGGTNLRNIANIVGSVDVYTSDTNISGVLKFATSPSGGSTPTEKMRIDASGNVGIGTSSPSNALSVARSSGEAVISITNSGTASSWLTLSPGSSGSAYIHNTGNTSTIFTTNGSERMRIDASGNVGIGTSSPSTYGIFATYGSVSNSGSALGAADATTSTVVNTSLAAVGNKATQSFNFGFGKSVVAGYYAAFNGSGDIATGLLFGTQLTTGGGTVERMRIDQNGNVGIGTTSPSYPITVSRSGANTYLYQYDGTGAMVTGSNGSGLGISGTFSNTAMAFFANSAEQMRIDTSGGVRIATTANIFNAASSEKLSVKNTVLGCAATFQTTDVSGGYPILYLSSTDTVNASQNTILFYRGASSVGSIGTTASATAYNTSSDYRLKENVAPITTGLATVSALKPVTYDWVGTNENGEGFIAHELQEVIPLAVTGEKDAVNEDGSIKPQGVDYSKIVVYLVAAIQELSAKNDALEVRLAKLENVQ